jgi:hypothetical protein
MEPVDGPHQSIREQGDVEAKMSSPGIELFLVLGQQINQERTQTSLAKPLRHKAIPRTVAAASRAVGEEHHSARFGRNAQISPQHNTVGRNFDAHQYNGSIDHDAHLNEPARPSRIPLIPIAHPSVNRFQTIETSLQSR